jgi:hypothetical protein
VAGDVCFDVTPTRSVKRADAVAVSWRQDSETARSSAAQQPNEHRLGPVVGVMTGRDAIRAGSRGSYSKRVPSRCASSRLEVPPGPHGQPTARKWNIDSPSKCFRQIEFGARLGPQAMVNSVREEAEREPLSQNGKHVQHGHRIGTAAHGRENDRSLRNQRALAERGAREGDERWRMCSRHGR